MDCFTFDQKVSPGLQDYVSTVRKTLQADLGIVLPGIKFRDNADLGTSQFRLLLRGLPLETHSFGERQINDSDRRKQLTSELEAVARENAASLYNLPECAAALAKLPSTPESEPIAILTDPNTIASLVLVLKTLLSESLPICALSDLVPTFSRSYSSGDGIAATATALRGLPLMAEHLPRNSSGQWPVSLPFALAKALIELVTQAGPDAPPEDWPDLRAQLRDFALQTVLKQPNATLVTDPSIRSLVAKGCAGIGLPVMATNEISPELSSRASHGNHKVAAQAAG
jgi:flagellar biosynthesis component FlhA